MPSSDTQHQQESTIQRAHPIPSPIIGTGRATSVGRPVSVAGTRVDPSTVGVPQRQPNTFGLPVNSLISRARLATRIRTYTADLCSRVIGRGFHNQTEALVYGSDLHQYGGTCRPGTPSIPRLAT